MWWVWILAALVCGIIEVMSVSFVFLMFAIGALAAGIAGALGANVTIQVIVFVVVTVALLAGLRPFLKGRIERSAGDATRTHPVFGRRVERAHRERVYPGGSRGARRSHRRCDRRRECRRAHAARPHAPLCRPRVVSRAPFV